MHPIIFPYDFFLHSTQNPCLYCYASINNWVDEHPTVALQLNWEDPLSPESQLLGYLADEHRERLRISGSQINVFLLQPRPAIPFCVFGAVPQLLKCLWNEGKNKVKLETKIQHNRCTDECGDEYSVGSEVSCHHSPLHFCLFHVLCTCGLQTIDLIAL